MKERAKLTELVIVGLIVATSIAAVVTADPRGAEDFGVVDSEQGPSLGSQSVPAEAGNVTELTINATAITQTWQGYFGNVSGTITLDDADNKTMYDWTYTTLQGEIYASNESSVTWANVVCFNLTDQGSGHTGNVTLYESYLGLGATDIDGVNETFDSQEHSQFGIGTNTISADSCWSIQTYINDAASTTGDFVEVIMYDNNSNRSLYAALLNDTVTGFDSKVHDFQMIVPVKGGHDSPATTDTFYFWIELG